MSFINYTDYRFIRARQLYIHTVRACMKDQTLVCPYTYRGIGIEESQMPQSEIESPVCNCIEYVVIGVANIN